MKHLPDEIDRTIARSFCAQEAAPPMNAFPGQSAIKFIGQPLVLAEKITDLPFAHSYIPGRYVGTVTDMAVKFGHERLAEPHHFHFRLPFNIKIRPAFSTAHRECG